MKMPSGRYAGEDIKDIETDDLEISLKYFESNLVQYPANQTLVSIITAELVNRGNLDTKTITGTADDSVAREVAWLNITPQLDCRIEKAIGRAVRYINTDDRGPMHQVPKRDKAATRALACRYVRAYAENLAHRFRQKASNE